MPTKEELNAFDPKLLADAATTVIHLAANNVIGDLVLDMFEGESREELQMQQAKQIRSIQMLEAYFNHFKDKHRVF